MFSRLSPICPNGPSPSLLASSLPAFNLAPVRSQDSTKDSGFEYIADEAREFLIFNTNDFHADTRSLYKIRKIIGMRLAQISTHNCYTQIWFYRSTYSTSKNK
jgi:hypothetical protein